MQLPFTLVVEPPTWGELKAAGRSPRTWLLALATGSAIALATTWWALRPGTAPRPEALAPLDIATQPDGALVRVDGQDRGRTPLSITVAPGTHSVLVRLDGHLDVSAQVSVGTQGASFTATLWPRQASALRLRPTYPGATIASAAFLADGRVTLTVALPSTDERQAWLFDPVTSAWEHLGAAGKWAGGIAVAPNGQRLAFLTRSGASAETPAGLLGSGSRLDELWIAGKNEGGARRYALPANATDERLAEVSWAPNGAQLLLASRQQVVGGAQRTRLLWLAPDGEADPRELVVLPSEVVPGSFSWSPAGDRVAFLARVGGGAAQLALCLVEGDGSFRYLADLSQADASASLPFPPLAWSADGVRLLYAAPAQEPATPAASAGLWPFGGGKPSGTLFLAGPAHPAGMRLAEAAGATAPVWRPDGSVLALTRTTKDDARIELRGVELPSGRTTVLDTLPVKTAGAAFAARWDTAHTQLLLAQRGSGTSPTGAATPEYWLVRFGEPGNAANGAEATP